MTKGSFLLLVLLANGCEETKTEQSTPAEPVGDRHLAWGLVVSTMQLVRESVDPAVCPSGWTMLQQELALRGDGHLPPLQTRYVTRFDDLYHFGRAATAAHTVMGAAIPTLRLSIAWPCWTANERWRNEMIQMITDLQRAGWHIELTLLHHDSYPASLHSGSGFGLGGWSHESAADAFTAYVESVVTTLRDILPPGSRIYVANELEASLFNGYLDPSGKWPPGGKSAGRSLAKAFLNARVALRAGARLIRAAGFEPAIAVNVRPLLGSTGGAAERTLDHLHNWWLLDALVQGCANDHFNGNCDNPEPSALDVVGLTFYGHMTASNDTVTLADGVEMALPIINVEPDADLFRRTLEDVYGSYGIEVGVAEIGFSSASLGRMETWLREYRSAVKLILGPHLTPFIHLHTLFEGAEFSEGEWQFHMVGDCGTNDAPCQLTPWGERVLAIVQSP